MQIWPAIDLRDGKCVRLEQGDYRRQTVFGDDPVKMARLARAGRTLFLARCGECHDAPQGRISTLGKDGWQKLFAGLGDDDAKCTAGKLSPEHEAKLKAFISVQLQKAPPAAAGAEAQEAEPAEKGATAEAEERKEE